MTGSINRLLEENKSWEFPIHFPDEHFWKDSAGYMKTRPNAGLVAMIDLLNYPIKELYITGFSFYRGGYLPEYKNWSEKFVMDIMAKSGNHQQEPQRLFLKELMKHDDRIKVDHVLGGILNED